MRQRFSPLAGLMLAVCMVGTLPVSAQTVTVRPGDTLAGLARIHLGNAARWRELCAANEDVLLRCDLILPGMVLRLAPEDRPVESPAPAAEATESRETPAAPAPEAAPVETTPVETTPAVASRNLAGGSDRMEDPDIWAQSAVLGGLQVERTGGGNSDGGPFVEYRISGVSTGEAVRGFYDGNRSRIPVTPAEAVTASVGIDLLGGSLPEGANLALRVVEYADGRYFRLSQVAYDPAGPASQFLEVTREMQAPQPDASALELSLIGLEAGTPVDLSLRISALQFERGAVATPYVAP